MSSLLHMEGVAADLVMRVGHCEVRAFRLPVALGCVSGVAWSFGRVA